jgi:hypothetical protein
MTVLKSRKRVLFFRVSEEEYRQFCGLCESRGARCLSDLARTAVFRMMEEGNGGESGIPVSDAIRGMDSEIRALRVEVTDLAQQIRTLHDGVGQSPPAAGRKGPAHAGDFQEDESSELTAIATGD